MFKNFSKSRITKLLSGAALVLSGLVFSASTHAIPITFTTDPANSSAEFTNTGGFCVGLGSSCTPMIVVNPNPVTFALDNIGDSFNIMDFLTVSISGPSLAFRGEGRIDAQLAFSAPSSEVSTAASGTGTFTSFFIFREGEVEWNSQPANLLFDDGTEVSLAFGGGFDSCVLFGCVGGLSVGIDATTTLQAVPEPTVLALLGAGLFGFGAFRRFGLRRS